MASTDLWHGSLSRLQDRYHFPRAPAARGPTNVYVAPAPVYGGYGYGMGGYGYGMGGGGNGMGLYLGLSVAESFIRAQERQAYLQQQLKTQQQLGADQAAIASLQRELSEQNSRVDTLRSQQSQGGAAQPSLQEQVAPGESEAMLKLRLQILEQQKELEALKATNAK